MLYHYGRTTWQQSQILAFLAGPDENPLFFHYRYYSFPEEVNLRIQKKHQVINFGCNSVAANVDIQKIKDFLQHPQDRQTLIFISPWNQEQKQVKLIFSHEGEQLIAMDVIIEHKNGTS